MSSTAHPIYSRTRPFSLHNPHHHQHYPTLTSTKHKSSPRLPSPTSVTDQHSALLSPPRIRSRKTISRKRVPSVPHSLPTLSNWICPVVLQQVCSRLAHTSSTLPQVSNNPASRPLSAAATPWTPQYPTAIATLEPNTSHTVIATRSSSSAVPQSTTLEPNCQVVNSAHPSSKTTYEVNSHADIPTHPISPVVPSPPTLEANHSLADIATRPTSSVPPSSTFEANSPADMMAMCPTSSVPQPTDCEAPNDKAFYITLCLHSIHDTPIYVHSHTYLSDYNKIGVIQPWGLVSLTALPQSCSHQDSYTLHNQRGFIPNKLASGQKWLYQTHHTPSTRPDSEELDIQCPASCDFPTVLAWWIDNLEFIVDKIYFEGWRYHPLNIEYWLGLRSAGDEVIVDDYFDRCGPRIAALQAAIVPTNFPFYGRLGDAFLCTAFAFLSELSNYQQEICQCRIDNIPLSNCIVMSTTHCLPITSLHTAPTPAPPTYPDDTDSYTSTIDDSDDTISNWVSDNEISDEDDDASYTSCQWKHVDNMRMINEWRPPLTPSLPFSPVPPAKFPPLLNFLLPITRMYTRCQERLYYARMQSLGHYKKEYLRATKHASSIHANPDNTPLLLHNHRCDRSLLPTTLYTGPRRRPPPTPCPSVTPPPRPASPTPFSPTTSASYQRATNTVNALMRHLPLTKPPPCTRGYRPRRALIDAVSSYTTTTCPTPPCQQYTKPCAVPLLFPVHDTPVPPRTLPTTPLCAMLTPPGCARIPSPRLPVSTHTFVTTHAPSVKLTPPANARSSIPLTLSFQCLFAITLTLLLPLISSLLYDTHTALHTLVSLPQLSLFPSSCCAQTPAPRFSVHMVPSTGIG